MIKPSCARTDSLNKCHFCRKMGSKQRRHRAFQVFFLLAFRSPHESTYPNRFPGFAVYCHWSFTALQLRCRSAHINSSRNKKNIQCRIDIDWLFAYMYDSMTGTILFWSECTELPPKIDAVLKMHRPSRNAPSRKYWHYKHEAMGEQKG